MLRASIPVLCLLLAACGAGAAREELIFPKTEPQYPRWSGSIYDTSNGTRRLHIEIRNYRNCESADSAAYPDTVRVRLDQRELQGCGRAF